MRLTRPRRYAAVVSAILALLLATFAIVEAAGVPLLTDPANSLTDGGPVLAALSFGLLAADVVLPVPSSVLMTANGAVFGAAAGAALSLAGATASTLLAFGIGRRAGPLLARLVTEAERGRADRFLDRWGMLAILVTRPVPLAAETVALMAGASPLSWRRAALAAVAGSLPGAVLYGLAGALAADFGDVVLVFGTVLVLAAALWLAGRRIVAPPASWADR